MHKLQFHYTFERPQPGDASDNQPTSSPTPNTIRNPLLDLLHAVQSSGSISGASRMLGLSYRHVWGELKRWQDDMGHELITWDKGQASRLTEFGEKLLWAERQAQARLAPQIASLQADLERAFALAFDDNIHVLTLYASHDDALSALRGHAAEQHQLHLDVRFMGSVDAIRALNEGRCVMAGFHTLSHPAKGSLTERTYRPLLKPGLHKIIGFAQRRQGLMMAPCNPLGLTSVADLAQAGVRLINRAWGTGTRVLLDELLAQANIDPATLQGYDHEEGSHAAVAQAIAAGAADAGLGIEAAALARGLGFVPLVTENYHLVCLKSALEEPAIQSLQKVLGSPAWHERLQSLGGYAVDPSQAGEVQSLRQTLPWWNYRQRKQTR